MLPHGECGTMGQSGLTPSAIPYFCRFGGKPIKTIARRAVGRPPQDQGFSLFTNRRERRGSAGRNGGGSMRVTTCEAKMADLERRIAVLRGPILRECGHTPPPGRKCGCNLHCALESLEFQLDWQRHYGRSSQPMRPSPGPLLI